MVGIIYKFTILTSLKYFGHKPFYVGQFSRNISRERFLRNDCFVYDGSGKTWERFYEGLRRKFPTCWRKLIKREILFYSNNCSQKVLDAMEAYYIKKEKAHYSYHLGGCNILWGTANKFGSGSPMKDPMVAKKVTAKIRGRKGAKRSAIGRINMSIAAKKSWKNAENRRKIVSNAVSEYMRNGGAKKLSNKRKGKKFSIETRMKISKNHADFKGSKHPLFGVKYDWINNGKINKRLNKGDKMPAGFIYGRIKRRKI